MSIRPDRRFTASQDRTTKNAVCNSNHPSASHRPPLPPGGLSPWRARTGYYNDRALPRLRLSERELEHSFHANFTKRPDGCWIWHGIFHPDGTPPLLYNGIRHLYAPNWAYRQFVDRAFPKRARLVHTCQNKRCVNPKHCKAKRSSHGNKPT